MVIVKDWAAIYAKLEGLCYMVGIENEKNARIQGGGDKGVQADTTAFYYRYNLLTTEYETNTAFIILF